ncbi:MAG: TRAP transporter substrate-binding protein DctP [Deltaproteobacteria bacterium]|nr:TRAP transporter substrate-binding protein DctP [Deltaproteobacteria bacterium]
MTHLLRFAFILLLLSTNLLAEPSRSSKYVIKIATLAPEGSSWLQVWTRMRQEIEEKTEGQITSQMYAGGVMGDDPDMVRKLRLGQLDVVAVTSLGAKLLVQELAVFDLPFLFEDWEEAEYVRNQLRPEFEKRFEEKGLYLIDWVHQGFVHINSQMPIRTPEKLSRQKVWAWAGEEVSIATLEALGVKPITTPVPEALSALQTGLVTVIPTGVLPLLALQWFNEVNYITPLNMRYELAVVAANKKNWDQIEPDSVRVINQTFANHRGEISTQVQKDSDIALEEMFRQGIKKIELTPSEREVFAQKTRPVWDQFAGKLYPRSLLDRVLEEREIYREKKQSLSTR